MQDQSLTKVDMWVENLARKAIRSQPENAKGKPAAFAAIDKLRAELERFAIQQM